MPGSLSQEHSEVGKRLELEPDTQQILADMVVHIVSDAITHYRRPPKGSVLLRSIVTGLVDAEEVLAGHLVGAYFALYPGAMGSEQKEFTLDELRALGSMDEVIAAAVDSRVDSFLRLTLDEWEKWFQRTFKLDIKPLALDWLETRELVQRRHVIVHNAGQVSPRYRRNVAPLDAPDVGVPLVVDEAYVLRAIDLTQVFGLLLAVEVWRKLVPEDTENAVRQLIQVSYAAMKSGRWHVVRALGEYASVAGADDEQRLMGKMNGFFARTKLMDPKVEGDLEALDASAHSNAFKVVRLTLLGRLDDAASAAKAAIAGGDLTVGSLEDWPILAQLRARPDVQTLIARDKRRLRRVTSRSAEEMPHDKEPKSEASKLSLDTQVDPSDQTRGPRGKAARPN